MGTRLGTDQKWLVARWKSKSRWLHGVPANTGLSSRSEKTGSYLTIPALSARVMFAPVIVVPVIFVLAKLWDVPERSLQFT